jgi:polyferredoxin
MESALRGAAAPIEDKHGASPPGPGRAKPRLARLGEALRRHRRTLLALQWVVVIAYAALLTIPAFLPLPPERAGILDDLTRFAQFVFWGLWWPFVILSIIALGRTWCGFLCPEGALTEWVSRYGVHWRMPRILQWSGWPFVAFVITTVYGQLVSVYEYPKPAMLILGGSTLGAVGVGLLYGREKRLWCRHLCPVNGVFALLARLAPLHYRVDRATWDRSHAKPSRINCAPLVHIKSMTGAADCHMCARCAGHKDAIALAVRPPGIEIAVTAPEAVPVWHARLAVWGLLGVAAGAFQWSASPWLVALKQGIAAWLVERNLLWPLAAPGHWWLLTDYPEANDVFSWLDGGLIVAYIAAVALSLGGWVSLWLVGAEKILRLPRARHALALVLMPFAGLSVFLGLFSLTTTQLAAEGITFGWLGWLRAALLGAGILWSLALAGTWLHRQSVPPARRRLAHAAVLAALALPLSAWIVLFYLW